MAEVAEVEQRCEAEVEVHQRRPKSEYQEREALPHSEGVAGEERVQLI